MRMFRSNLDNSTVKNTHEGDIYPVYVNSRIVSELIAFCKSTYPKEALAFLLGVKAHYKNDSSIEFTRIVDYVTGSVESTHISANFTAEGLQQANLYLDDKFGRTRERNSEIPKIVGIVHSHPFGHEPSFSSTDLDTFLNFPYDAPGNVFILIDPVPANPYFKVYKIITEDKEKILQHVPWVEYSSVISDYEGAEQTYGLQLPEEVATTGDDDPYTPPKIEDLNNKNRKNKNKKGNVREFFS